MTVLIKGMKLPKKGYKDLRIHADGSWSAYAETVPYNDIYGAAVEVPTPHGRLIDVDELLEIGNKTGSWCNDRWYIKVSIIHDAPTVIEAEEG